MIVETKTYMQLYRETNKEKIAQKKKEYREKKKEEITKYNRDYRDKNKTIINERQKKYKVKLTDEEKIKLKEYQKEYRETNKEILYNKHKERRNNDELYRLTCDIRSLIGRVFREQNITKNTKTEKILDCTFEELKLYMESKFESWMTWENKGNPKDGVYELNKTWDVDHIIPLSTITCEDDIIKLNHYTNLQPLCSYVNRYIKRDNQ